MDGDERAEEGSAGLRSDDECRLKISERLGERRSQPTQDACVGPPPGGVGGPSGIGPIAAPLEGRLEIAQKPGASVGFRTRTAILGTHAHSLPSATYRPLHTLVRRRIFNDVMTSMSPAT
jgi:hypothetical protein